MTTKVRVIIAVSTVVAVATGAAIYSKFFTKKDENAEGSVEEIKEDDSAKESAKE